ncbi:cell adhesion molecule 3 isoform X1 [Falco cherrug]|uniref:cell adhesion molecule 3 isoform X1 n=1 Tax=Falco cherrug TaxID=345164 RepID=UPI00247895AD|nr:cell adhesion molecule 3 isoform X1 [Falco cherrug]
MQRDKQTLKKPLGAEETDGWKMLEKKLLACLHSCCLILVALQPESQPTTSDETVVAGGTVVLKCQVEDPDDSSLQWSNPAQQTLYFGEKRALRDNRIQLERSTPNELTISISDVVLSDEGEYTCSIFTMPVRTAKALVTVLGIPQKPQIFGHEQPIDEEKIARLTCRSSGSKPAAQLRWKKGNKELKDEGTEVVEDPNGKTFTVSSRVEFRVTKEDNEAEVTCTVDHESLQNSERSTTQKLQVHYKPTAKIEPHPQYPREGEKLQLQCDGQGNPIPREFLWEKEGSDVPLQLSSDSVLIFPFLNKSDSGTYVCTATSSMGSVVAKYNLDVSDFSQLPTPHVHSTPAPPPGPSQSISHASMATASSFTPAPIQDASPVPSTSSTYHAVIGGVVAVIVFLLLSLLIVLGHYLIRHKEKPSAASVSCLGLGDAVLAPTPRWRCPCESLETDSTRWKQLLPLISISPSWFGTQCPRIARATAPVCA